VVTSKPISILAGHKAGLNDVQILSDKRLIFSYDKVAVLKTWDIDLGNCLQTLSLNFPSFEVLGKEIEFGKPALYTESAAKDLILVRRLFGRR
jgi:WD40 repeat protein